MTDRLCQSFVFLQLTAIFLQLVECIGHVTQQIGRERGKRLREGIGQATFVGFFGELRLPKLDERIHQRRIPRRTELKQAFVNYSAVGRRGIKNLAMIP